MGKRPTINDVADYAGVSKRTVSRVLNNLPYVNEKTRAAVKAAMLELEYSPDRGARGLASRRSFLMGLVYCNPNALYIADVQSGILDECRTLGYELVVHPVSTAFSDGLADEVVDFVERMKLDGIIALSPVSQDQRLFDRLDQVGRSYIRVLARDASDPEKQIISEDRKASAELADYFLSLGHRKIGLIMGPEDYFSALERQGGFVDALGKNGFDLKNLMIRRGEYTFGSGLTAARQLLREDNRPTAIFASNDVMACAVIAAARELGLDVPRDVSVAGFDGGAFAQTVTPALTTLTMPMAEIGRQAARALAKLIGAEGGGAFEVRHTVCPALTVRNSTGPAPAENVVE